MSERPTINGFVKWRTNATVHVIDARFGMTLCGIYCDEPHATDKEPTCRVCIVRSGSLTV